MELRKENILIVDDDHDMIDIISGFMSYLYPDIKVMIADNVFKAGVLVEKNKPNLIFLDILMPGISGTEFCKSMKSSPEGDDIKIVGMTASKSEEVQNSLIEAGASEILLKPITKKMVEYVVGEIILKC